MNLQTKTKQNYDVQRSILL